MGSDGVGRAREFATSRVVAARRCTRRSARLQHDERRGWWGWSEADGRRATGEERCVCVCVCGASVGQKRGMGSCPLHAIAPLIGRRSHHWPTLIPRPSRRQ